MRDTTDIFSLHELVDAEQHEFFVRNWCIYNLSHMANFATWTGVIRFRKGQYKKLGQIVE